MKVFISWSGLRSKAIASALRELLPDALQSVEAWMSDHEIAAGTRWSNELGNALEGSAFGIICLTPENLSAPWLLFEAGSLAKSVATSRVVPYLFDLAPTDVTFPLAQFQGSQATRAGTLRLLQGINEILESPLPTERLQRVFDSWWPKFEIKLQSASQLEQTAAVRRNEREILEEILELVRKSRSNVTSSIAEPSTPYAWLRNRLQVEEAGIASQREAENTNYTGRGFPTPEPFERIMEEREHLILQLRGALAAFEALQPK